MPANEDPLSEARSADVAIIGLGSAGEALAGRLLAAGFSVVGFETGFVGGECPFIACMPSKSLLHDAHLPRTSAGDAWTSAVQRRDEVAEQRDDSSHAAQLLEQGLTLVRHRAEIAGPRRVVADGTTWTTEHVVIATGSSPVIPPIEGLDPERSWTSDDALISSELPFRLVIIGAGAIGCELGDVYRSFGSSVVVLEAADRLLPDHDEEVAQLYARRLCSTGLDLRLSSEVAKIEHGTVTNVVLGDGSSIPADRLLVATGQAPRLAGLGLSSIGLDDAEVPQLDEQFAVIDHPWLRMIGDVNGRSPWTHGANREAEQVASAIGGRPWEATTFVMPHAVFTDPPAAHVGSSAETHEAAGHRTVRGVGRTGDVARHSTDQLADGMVVLTVDVERGVVVGGSAVGALADEMIATITSWVHLEATIERARTQVFAFPTISQIIEVAAADAYENWLEARTG